MGVAAVCAGWVDAVVGGGGLIQLPALLLGFPHVAPVQILATNKLSSIAGTSASAGTYYRRLRPDLLTVIPLALLAFAGSLIGASLVSHISRAAFNPVILVVLVAVGTYTLLTPDLGALTNLRFSGRRHTLAAVGVGFVIGIYDGALGPGTGSFLVFALVGLLGYAFLQASAKAKIANVATNLAALVIFIPQGAVMWKVALLMGLGNFAGGYVGARTAVAQGAGFIRVVLVIVLGAFTIKIGLDVIGQFS
jgi:uncharacterized membrane protein YfcA